MERLLWKEVWQGDTYAFYAYVSHETLPNYHVFKHTPAGYEEYFFDDMNQASKDNLPMKVPFGLHMKRKTGELYGDGRMALTTMEIQQIDDYIHQRYHIDNPRELKDLLHESGIQEEAIEALVTIAGVHYGFLKEGDVPTIHAYDKSSVDHWQEYPVPQELLPVVLQAYADTVGKPKTVKTYLINDKELLILSPTASHLTDVPQPIHDGMLYVIVQADESHVHGKQGSWLAYDGEHYQLPTQTDMYNQPLITAINTGLEALMDHVFMDD